MCVDNVVRLGERVEPWKEGKLAYRQKVEFLTLSGAYRGCDLEISDPNLITLHHHA